MNLILVILYLCGIELMCNLFLNLEIVWSFNRGEFVLFFDGILSNLEFNLDFFGSVLKLRDLEWDFGCGIVFGKCVFLSWIG